MPFTPFHIGPHACASLPLGRRIDVPVFVGVSFAIDLEPLAVMLGNLDYPLHGWCHTLLVGGLAGLLCGGAAYPFRGLLAKAMDALRLPYAPTLAKMTLSGALGAMLHVLLDAPLYADIRPFFPSAANPLYQLLSPAAVYAICAASFLPAVVMAVALARRAKQGTRS